MKKLICTFVCLFCSVSYSYNAEVPCNLTHPNKAEQAKAKKRIADLLRTPATLRPKTRSIDEKDEDSIREYRGS